MNPRPGPEAIQPGTSERAARWQELSENIPVGIDVLRSRPDLSSAFLFACRAPESLCWVAGDGAQLQIGVANLLRNAQEALLAAATVQPRIAVALRRSADALELVVEDNGLGLPPDLLAGGALTGGQAGGMGVGLYVVNTTMENHGGSLRLGRSPLGGAALTLRFPALPTPSASPASG